ncbi:outer membrane protein assembly factor BamA [Herbaspirillum sp. RTI4]|uniref:outer membrane protein assembly factor BamA n=1 Tax=Herbaspirillum sp. RTI4 TaxID=3048640 RepID=UPI002AB4C1AE|nr:outer membrane protein assembly factor BamA [Herbaspirillum sp. RTI4]MDY7578698.1 outer membrane protein assembly factor BamA [Herbaspirillum sp. RTI4]MEA9980604.1 outer membrane protein assembly factor BamA [Herbaspirillum sp. RTI4]
MKLHTAYFPLPSFSRSLVAAAVFALCSSQAQAVEPFVVKDIRVEGIQRTEAGTVFGYLPVHVGDTFNDDKAVTAIKALYATGFFKDVRIESEGNVLVVQVEERPAIASIEFIGTKEFDKDQLNKAMKEIGVSESRIFDKSLVDRGEQELKRQYLTRGLYGAKVTTTVTPVERNRVAITFNVDEGEVSRIKLITIVGNKAFSDSALRSELKLTTPGWFTWYTKADQYSKQKLSVDVDALRSFYLDRGYLEMQVDSSQVSITPDKKDIYITININEGEKYTVSGVKLEGDTLGLEDQIKPLIQFKAGEIYSGSKLTETSKKISERLGNFGYAFANINTIPAVDREKREVAFTLLVDPGKRVYVRKVNISGNTGTRDEVVRREFRQFEDSWYDGAKIKLSRDRVDRLGYFKEVNIDTPEVPGVVDQVDVNMSVVEKPTGNIMLGAGFSQQDKVSLTGSITQANVFGSGNTIGVEVNTSSTNRTIAVSQTTPYFTDDGISRTYDAYLRTTQPSVYTTGYYKVRTTGADVRFGVPFSELDTIFFGLGIENTAVYTDSTSPNLYQQYVTSFGNSPSGIGSANTTSFPLTAAWQRDSRDSSMVPTEGRFQRANIEVSGVGNLRYYRATYQHQYFQPLFSKAVTLALNGELDYGRGFGGQPYPIFKNFYAGGIGSVRGYEPSSLGDKVDQYGNSMGGASRVLMNAEFQFPFPGSGQDRTLRWFTFVDGGNVFADQAQIKLNGLRYGAGIGISWLSPIGPIKLSYGKPLNATSTDKVQNFQFQLGTGF